MNKTWKRIGLGLAALLSLLLLAAAALYGLSSRRLDSAPDVAVHAVLAAGPDALDRGEHLVVAITGCTSCHGEDLGGLVSIDDPAIGTIYASNLTKGAGGVGATYSDEDWARAIRHGIGADNRVLGGMPSNAYAHLSDADLAALLAYVQSLPPVDNILPSRNLSLPGTIIFGTLAYNTLPVNLINHAAVGGAAPEAGPKADYGEYLVSIAGCADCHGPDLGGIDPENAPPGPPPGPSLQPSGGLRTWTEDDFITALRSGRTPQGRQLSEAMPWKHYALMSDAELQAIWRHLAGLDATAAR
jgi:cytochrome c553